MGFGGGSGAQPYRHDAMTAGEISPPHHVSQRSSNPAFTSTPGLSLGLQSNMEEQMDMSREGAVNGGGGNDAESANNNREDENDSKSESDNLEAVSGDDIEQENPCKKKKKRYHRHTPHQIQELEAMFKECPHPDEKQRLELSKRLSLESRQVKFWFQNRRTQMKTQIERHENSILRQENDKLRAENMTIREAMRNPVCNNCGGPAMLGEVSVEEHHLRVENARLKEELDRVCALAGKFLGRPISALATCSISSAMPSSALELGIGNSGFTGLTTVAPTISPAVPNFLSEISNPLGSLAAPSVKAGMVAVLENERSLLLELAMAAMEELVSVAHAEEPLWIPSSDGGGREALNYSQYQQSFRRLTSITPPGYVSEASRESGIVIINSLALIETLMNANHWADMFPSIVAKATATEVLPIGVGGTKNGALQLMHAELQVLSPMVGIREVSFLRFCKQHAEGIWAVVDVSIDSFRDHLSSASTYTNCRRLPSGCVVQDLPNGYSKVTWLEHAEYNEEQVHQIYRPLLRSGLAFGAARWVASLQRQCEFLAILFSSTMAARDDETASTTVNGRRSMLKLAQRMTNAFCAGICASSAHEWSKLEPENIDEDVRFVMRKSVNDAGEPAGVVLSAATAVWIPMPPKRLFDFLREASFRSRWDILSNRGPMYEMAQIAKGQDTGNAVSLLRSSQAVNSNQTSMLILQDACIDASGAMVVYAPVDVPAMHLVMNGGDSACAALLPSGFAVLPDGAGSGSLLTVGFQILLNGQSTAKLTADSVETVSNLISCTVQKIKAAFHCED